MLHRLIWLVRVLVMVSISLAAGAIGSLFSRESTFEWYAVLNKPPLTPPNWVFGMVWTILYVLMGMAAGLIWNVPIFLSRVRASLLLFLIHLVLNVTWVALFFGFQLIGWAMLELVLLWAIIIVLELFFYSQSKLAGILLWPYLAWVTFALYLNAGILTLNR